ncbi:MAG: hypothetical protein IKC73_02940 [Clostridia bacterium]|nr:hypothetical protein [Clostridia bacterium]
MKRESLREEFEGAVACSGGPCAMGIGCIEKHDQHLPPGTAPVGCSRTLAAAAMDITVDRLAHIFEVLRDDEECLAMNEDVEPS